LRQVPVVRSILSLHIPHTNGDLAIVPDLDGVRVVRVVVHWVQAKQGPGLDPGSHLRMVAVREAYNRGLPAEGPN
jgi:hypothetical protein